MYGTLFRVLVNSRLLDILSGIFPSVVGCINARQYGGKTAFSHG